MPKKSGLPPQRTKRDLERIRILEPVRESPSRRLKIIAQDPSILVRDSKGKPCILTASVDVPVENLAPGPRGYRVHVIDYDASSKTLYEPKEYPDAKTDPYEKAPNRALLNDPGFHAQNVYAIVMRTLAAFEFALGRRIGWAFQSHQLQVSPHAFSIANAFYSRRDQALMFGYFTSDGTRVFTSLSHDIIAHETTHALLDGLRERYTDPSSIDQVGFHEGFADVVAMLSVFSLPEVVSALLSSDSKLAKKKLIAKDQTTEAVLIKSALLGLGEQMGRAMPMSRGDALRRSVELEADPTLLDQEEFIEPHRRGEVFVACMMRAFVKVWRNRLETLGEVQPGLLHLDRVIEDGARAAKHLMTMAIRALDYCPPTALRFNQFLTALLIADEEIQPDDSQHHYRDGLKESFGAFGIERLRNQWLLPEAEQNAINYRRSRFESLCRDEDEVFRFIWENRRLLKIHEQAFTKVISVRPCMRLSPEGFYLRETVAEYIQIAYIPIGELALKLKRDLPANSDEDATVKLYGGGALIFDEYGRLKYHAHNPVIEPDSDTKRLAELWDLGYFVASNETRFSRMHLARATSLPYLASRKEISW